MTQYLGLIGYPLGHSVSPSMHQAAFAHLGIDARYELWETEQGALSQAVAGLREDAKLGANVTIPYKEVVIPLLDGVDDAVDEIGAVNTVVKRDGKLVGHNTDAGGFLRSLRQEGGFDPAGKRAVVIGAGGAARAVSFALANAGAKSLALTDVVAEKAQSLAADLQRRRTSTERDLLAVKSLSPDSGEFAAEVWDCDLLVNCTPLGMRHSDGADRLPLEAALIPKGALVYDVVYNPPETPLMVAAGKARAKVLGGLGMLVYQGALAFELWTGREAPVDIMMAAAREALT
jgi:shikimate dehydrogenase